MTIKDVADRVSPVVVESFDSRAKALAAVNRGADDDAESSDEKSKKKNNKNLRIRIKLPRPDAEPESGGGRVGSSNVVVVVKPGLVVEEEEAVAAAPSHVCTVCGKGFRSGKALGGHMRVHTQQIRAHDVVITDVVDDGLEDGGGELKQICPICKKGFPTDKALFGHMRCHPDRSWRGIQPPLILKSFSSSGGSSTLSVDVLQLPPAITNTSFNESDDASDVDENLMAMSSAGKGVVSRKVKKRVDLEKDLADFGWGAKAVRGREATVPNAAGASGNNNTIEPDHDAVENLMLLSKRCAAGQELEEEEQADVISDPFKPLKKRKLYTATDHQGLLPAEFDHHLGRAEVKKMRKNSEAEEEVRVKKSIGNYHQYLMMEQSERIRNSAANNGADHHHKFMQMEHNKVPKSYLMVDDWKSMAANLPAIPQPTPVRAASGTTPRHNSTSHQVKVEVPEGERYKCTTCNKSFSSHQALGGHKSSHNKLAKNVGTFGGISRGDAQVDRLNLGLTLGVNSAAAAAEPAPPIHQCNVCLKVYPSGQALGGHKRLHCTSLTPKAPMRNVNVILPEEAATTPQRNVVNIIPSEAPPPPPALAPKHKYSDETVSTREEAVCLFDLNELPPLEDEEVAVQPAAAAPALLIPAARDDVYAPPASAKL